MVILRLMVSSNRAASIMLIIEVSREASLLGAFWAPIKSISLVLGVTLVHLAFDTFAIIVVISHSFALHFEAIIGAYTTHSLVSFGWVLIVSVFVVHKCVKLFWMHLRVFMESVWFLSEITTISISRILRLSFFSSWWVVSWVLLVGVVLILLLSWAPSSMFFNLNLHL